MDGKVTTSWRRRSDASMAPDDERLDEKSAAMRSSAQKLEHWEDEGGRTGAVATEVVRVLIVDNDMRAADALELMLNSAGYPETRVAYSAQAALALATQFRPHIAFLEMNLLDLDSNDLAQRLRERAQIQHLRLIALTDSREHAGRDAARNAGFERYLLKPVAPGELSNLLAS